MKEDIESRRLELEERRLTEEILLKNKELEIRDREIKLREREIDSQVKDKNVWSQIFSPVGVAVIVGLLGLIGTAVSGLLNVVIESSKQEAAHKLEREKQEANLILKMSEITDDKRRASNLLFFSQVGYLDFDDKRIDSLRKQAGLNPGDQAPAPSIAPSTLVETPQNINQSLTRVQRETLMRIFGVPCESSPYCSPVTNPKIKGLIVTEDVGPFKVTGLKPAVDALRRIFTDVKQHEPELYSQIRNQGMLCCKESRSRVRETHEGHAWGVAIDLMIEGRSEVFGDKKTQSGLIKLAPYFQKEKFFWGAEGAIENSMHFEVSDELIKEWEQQGVLSS